jgi:hypothetical protein
MTSEWAYITRDGEKARYLGIQLRLAARSLGECWAVFDDDELDAEAIERLPVTKNMPELREADLFGLTGPGIFLGRRL